MNNLKPDQFFDLTNYKHAKIFEFSNFVWDVFSNLKKYLDDYKKFEIEVDIPSNAFLINPETIAIGKGTVIEPGAYIKGPCIIGENCVIRHGAYIRGNFIAGDRCVIGHDTEVKNSIMLDDAHASHFAYLGDALIGNFVNLGAGVKCANLKLNRKNISIYFDGKVISTGLRKLGAILGDGSQLGCNSVTNPGTITGKNVFCYPCVNFGGVVPSNSFIKSNAKCVIEKMDLDSQN